MLRRAAFLSLASAVVFFAACGRQITPSPTSSNDNLAGHVVVKFDTVGAMDFTKYDYAVVVDTCGGGTPYPNVFATSFQNYSYSFNVGTTPTFGASSAFPVLLQYIITPGSSNNLNPQVVPVSSSLTSLTPNSNGSTNEFEIIFDREQLNNPKQVAQPCPQFTQPPVAGSPTASASAAASAAPTSSATIAPNAQPTLPIQANWAFNFFVISRTGTSVLDSLGTGAGQDVTYNGAVIDTQTTTNNLIVKTPDTGGGGAPSDPAAQIQGGEIDNYQ